LGKNNEGIVEPITLKSVTRNAKQHYSDEAAAADKTGNICIKIINYTPYMF
jgi:hypothetical protein